MYIEFKTIICFDVMTPRLFGVRFFLFNKWNKLISMNLQFTKTCCVKKVICSVLIFINNNFRITVNYFYLPNTNFSYIGQKIYYKLTWKYVQLFADQMHLMLLPTVMIFYTTYARSGISTSQKCFYYECVDADNRKLLHFVAN